MRPYLCILILAAMAPLQGQTSRQLDREIQSTEQAVHQLQEKLQEKQNYLDDLYLAEHGKKTEIQQEQHLREMQEQIRQLTLMVSQLSRSLEDIQEIPVDTMAVEETETEETSPGIYTESDSLALRELQQRQAASRRQIDALTMDLIEISRKLKDPDRRMALARKLKDGSAPRAEPPPGNHDSLEEINPRDIDLAAVELIRQGQTLDQARMAVIEDIGSDRLSQFYKDLPREDRYHLYDIADEIMDRKKSDLDAARREALFFFFYVQ